MTKLPKAEGIVVPVVTPYKTQEKEQIDFEVFEKHLDYLQDNGIEGIFLLGTNGEAPLLNLDERKSIVKFAIKELPSRLDIYVGTGFPGFNQTLSFSRFAEDEGADFLVVSLPYFYGLNQGEIIDYYVKLTESLELPILVYNKPVTRGVNLLPETFSKLSKIDQIVGLKDSAGNLMQFHQYVKHSQGEVSMLMGRDGLVLPSLVLGGDGAVSGLSNFCPGLALSLYEKFKTEDYRTAQEYQDKLLSVEDAVLQSPSAVAGIKKGVSLQGFSCEGPRSPLSSLSKPQADQLTEVLKNISII